MESHFYLMNPWWEGKQFDAGLQRKKYTEKLQKSLDSKEIYFLTGLRRVGKTMIMKQVIKELLTKIDAKQILYITLDFAPFNDKNLYELIEEFRQIHSHKRATKLYLFLDEITYLTNFEQELKNLYDLENVKVYASSSSASLMKSKSSHLVGRSKMLEVLPLDFEEFLFFKNTEIGKDEPYLIKKLFDDYLKIGGMPEYVLTEDITYIKDMIEQIIYKDIIAMHDIKDKQSVERLFLLLCERVGKRTTYSKLSRVLGISVDSVTRYVQYFKDTFLFYTIDRHAKSFNERTQSPKKLYIADTGIKTTFSGFKDKGALFENLVFMKIKDKNPNYFYEKDKEIDFVIGKIAIEAKYRETTDLEMPKTGFEKTFIIKDYHDLKNMLASIETTP